MEEVSGQLHILATLPLGKEGPVSIRREGDGPHSRSGRGGE